MAEDNDIEFDDEFAGMSEAQIDALADRLMKEYSEMLDAMTPRQLYEHRRRRRLALCLRQRRLIREYHGIDIFRKMLRSTQRRLVECRIEYRSGVRPGHA